MSALGIIDAGIGGLGIYRELRQRSDASIAYFSDSGFSPYGVVDTDELAARLQQIFDFLHKQGVKRVAVACNAASCAFPNDDDHIGIIRFGVQKILDSKHKCVGVIGGERTIRTNAYGKHFVDEDIDIIERVAQPLSRHVEAGRLTGDLLHADIKQILYPLRNTDAVLLGCTHYPAIADEIRQYVSPRTELIDPATLMVGWLKENWLDGLSIGESKGENRWFTSGNLREFTDNAKAAFGVEIINPEQVKF